MYCSRSAYRTGRVPVRRQYSAASVQCGISTVRRLYYTGESQKKCEILTNSDGAVLQKERREAIIVSST